MSDVFPGEGWWMASDGKWYAPQLHHDPAYRAKYSSPDRNVEDEALDGETEEVDVEVDADVEDSFAGPEEPAEPAGAEPASAEAPEGEGSPSESGSGWVDEDDSVVGGAVPEEPAVAGDSVATAERSPDAVDGPGPDVAGATAPVRGMPPPVVKPVEPPPASEESTPAFAGEAPPRDSIRWPDLPGHGSEPSDETVPDAPDVAASEPIDDQPEVFEQPDDGAAGSPVSEEPDDDEWVSHGPRAESPNGAVTVAPSTPEPPSARPAFETKRPPSVVGDDRPSRARLEVGRPAAPPMDLGGRATPSTISIDARPKATLTKSESGLAEIRVYKEPAELVDRAVAAVLFLSGLAMIVGTFVDWVREAGADTTGWERGDGIATVFAGVLGAAAAGPIFVGFRHIVPKTAAIVCGLIGAVVVGLVGLDVSSDSAAAGTALAPGFWVTLAGSLAMIVAGVAERTSIR